MVEAEATTQKRREYAPRNSLEYADKLLQTKYGDKFELLSIDLILANLNMRERDIAMAFLMAAMKLRQLEKSIQDLHPETDIDWTIAEDYELAFCYLVESSRAIDAKTLDAATIQRLEQKSTYKEETQPQKAWYRRL